MSDAVGDTTVGPSIFRILFFDEAGLLANASTSDRRGSGDIRFLPLLQTSVPLCGALDDIVPGLFFFFGISVLVVWGIIDVALAPEF